jgi:hypothetical protein
LSFARRCLHRASERQRRLVHRQRGIRGRHRLRYVPHAGPAAAAESSDRPRLGHHAGADVTLTAGGERIALTSSGAVSFLSADAQATAHGVKLSFTFEHRAQRLLFTRVYACYPGSPTIETWTRITSSGGDGAAITDLVGWQMTMPVGHIRWLGGLRGDSAAGDVVEDAFVVADRDLDPGERIELGSNGRSSETFVPLLFVNDGRDEFYGGLMWSGAWRAALQRSGDRLQVSVYFPVSRQR